MNHRKAKGPTPSPGSKGPCVRDCNQHDTGPGRFIKQLIEDASKDGSPFSSSTGKNFHNAVQADVSSSQGKCCPLPVILVRIEKDLALANALYEFHSHKLNEVIELAFVLELLRTRLLHEGKVIPE